MDKVYGGEVDLGELRRVVPTGRISPKRSVVCSSSSVVPGKDGGILPFPQEGLVGKGTG